MPFRDPLAAHTGGFDPLQRVGELFAAFDAERGIFGDRAPLRLGAVMLASMAGSAAELTQRVRGCAARLDQHYGGWFSSVDRSVSFVIAATLSRSGESFESFVAAIDRLRARMDQLGVRRGGVHSLIAAMVLRQVVAGEPGDPEVQRMRLIYERMKHHHWFLTGPEDLAACAMLVARPGTPHEIGDHVEAIYRRLAAAPKIWSGDELQTAANVLGLIELAPDEVATRFLELAASLRERGVKVRSGEYDEIAVLAFLPRSAPQITERVVAMRERILAELSWYETSMATNLAADLVFVEFLQSDDDPRIAALARAKFVLDMQSIVASRQAAAATV